MTAKTKFENKHRDQISIINGIKCIGQYTFRATGTTFICYLPMKGTDFGYATEEEWLIGLVK